MSISSVETATSFLMSPGCKHGFLVTKTSPTIFENSLSLLSYTFFNISSYIKQYTSLGYNMECSSTTPNTLAAFSTNIAVFLRN